MSLQAALWTGGPILLIEDEPSVIAFLRAALERLVTRKHRRFTAARVRFAALDLRARVGRLRRTLDERSRDLRIRMDRAMIVRRRRFEAAALQLDERSPFQLLNRGYAIVYDASGKVLRSTDQVSISDDISEPRLASIAKMLSHSDPLVRIQAAQALGRVGAKAQATVPKLIIVLKKDDQTDVVMSCLWALGQMETAAISAAPAVRELIKHPDSPDPMKKAAAIVLDTIEGKNEKTKDKKGKAGKVAAEK